MSDESLKLYMKKNFNFSALKKAGFFGPDIRFNDYEKQAERVCHFFGLKNIYEFSSIGAGTRYHLTEDDTPLPTFTGTIRDRFGEDIAYIIEETFTKKFEP